MSSLQDRMVKIVFSPLPTPGQAPNEVCLGVGRRNEALQRAEVLEDATVI